MTKVLVVAAHADDEVLGCGGTIARHVSEGDTVHVVFVADGVTSRGAAGQADLMSRQRAAENARNILGISSVMYLGLPDNRLDGLALLDIVQPLEVVISEFAPEIIYTHHHGDLNVDHRLVHQAVMTACRPVPESSIRQIFTFEVLSSTEWSSTGLAPFSPNHYVDIAAFMETKIRALEAYALEMRTPPHSRSIEHARCLASHRGYCVGIDFAEGFAVVRSIL